MLVLIIPFRHFNEWNRLPAECVLMLLSVNMFKNKIDNYFQKSWYVYTWAMSITGHSISHWLPRPAPYWVPNTIGT